ncbi:MAG: TatD family hydrolase [Deltaproteobacteria bacterium]|jgi:TatD DNase family protein|nr:TatD family hydrolase [Deltaproteobacteria bacterium]
MEIFDSHTHLYLPEFAHDLDEVLERASAAGVTHLVNIGLDLATSETAILMAGNASGHYASVGWHPHETLKFQKDYLKSLVELALKDKVVAFGEIGLDYYRSIAPREDQLEVFKILLRGAIEAQKGVVIHSRDAFNDTLELLTAVKGELKGILIHCFGGDASQAEAYLKIGAYISIPGAVTFPKNTVLREALKSIPRDRLLVETDAPYLAPQPVRGKRNEPSYLIYHLGTMAEVLGISLEDMAQITTQNAKKFFNV